MNPSQHEIKINDFISICKTKMEQGDNSVELKSLLECLEAIQDIQQRLRKIEEQGQH